MQIFSEKVKNVRMIDPFRNFVIYEKRGFGYDYIELFIQDRTGGVHDDTITEDRQTNSKRNNNEGFS